MPAYLLNFDQQCFRFINHSLSNPLLDWLMPWLRNPLLWIPLYVFIIGFSIWKYRKRGSLLIFSLLLCVGIADFSSASLIKPLIKRNRPCRDVALASVIQSRVPCGTGYSFPSTHATDHFSIAIFLSMAYSQKWPRVWFWAILWAALVCFAQVYVGVHFPLDVLAGAAYGTLTGIVFATLFKKFHPEF